MSKADVVNIRRIHTKPDWYFEVQDENIDFGDCMGFTVSYFEYRGGKPDRVSHLTVTSPEEALAIGEALVEFARARMSGS